MAVLAWLRERKVLSKRSATARVQVHLSHRAIARGVGIARIYTASRADSAASEIQAAGSR